MVACGLLFVGGGIIAAGYFLSVEEVRALKRTEILQNLSLGLISIGLFTAFGVEFVLSFAGLWLLGALIGGLVGTHVLARVK
jgi:VanZ family protein